MEDRISGRNLSMTGPKEVEDILERLRQNSVSLSEYHRKRFYEYKSYAKYFRIPIILLSILNSTAAVGLVQVGVDQIIVSRDCQLFDWNDYYDDK